MSTSDDVRVLRDGFTHRWAPQDGNDSIDSNTGFGAPTRVDPDAQEPVIPFKDLRNPAKSWRDYRLGVIFPSTDFQFSVVTSYFLNECDTAS